LQLSNPFEIHFGAIRFVGWRSLGFGPKGPAFAAVFGVSADSWLDGLVTTSTFVGTNPKRSPTTALPVGRRKSHRLSGADFPQPNFWRTVTLQGISRFVASMCFSPLAATYCFFANPSSST
jgi:hypothetical protein